MWQAKIIVQIVTLCLLASCNLHGVSVVEQHANVKVQFVNSRTGWIVGPRLLRTTDGGRTWAVLRREGIGTFQLEDISIARQKIQFVSSDVGFILGGDGVVETTDGGYTWFEQASVQVDRNFALESIFFISLKEGWAVGKYVYHTSDGGGSWQRLSETPEGDPEKQIYMHVAEENANYNPALWFVTAIHGFMARLDGEVYETNDGGTTWKMILRAERRIEDIFFVGPRNGWMVDSEGFVWRSVNGGTSWTPIKTPTTNSLHSVFFISEEIGWAVGDEGTVLYTKDGGARWEKGLINGSSKLLPPLASVSFLDEFRGWAVGGLSDPIDRSSKSPASNLVLTTEDGGRTWSAVQL